MAKILKSTTGSDIDLDILAIIIAASGQGEINVEDYLVLGSDESITELTPLINSGDIVVNDGTTDLSASEGLAYVQYPDDEANIRFDNSTNDFDADEGQGAIEEARDTLIHKTFTLTFWSSGIISGTEWLNYSNHGSTSNQAPAVVPFNCELFAISFSNQENGINFDLDIRAADYNSGNSDTSRLTFNNVEARTAVTSSFTRPSFNAGDKIGIQISDNGGFFDPNPNDPIVILYFRITDNTLQTLTEDWSGNF
jgi:hypothetical protein